MENTVNIWVSGEGSCKSFIKSRNVPSFNIFLCIYMYILKSKFYLCMVTLLKIDTIFLFITSVIIIFHKDFLPLSLLLPSLFLLSSLIIPCFLCSLSPFSWQYNQWESLLFDFLKWAVKQTMTFWMCLCSPAVSEVLNIPEKTLVKWSKVELKLE